MNRRERCETCGWWAKYNGKVDAGDCHRLPPERTHEADKWAITRSDDYCGEWKPKEEPDDETMPYVYYEEPQTVDTCEDVSTPTDYTGMVGTCDCLHWEGKGYGKHAHQVHQWTADCINFKPLNVYAELETVRKARDSCRKVIDAYKDRLHQQVCCGEKAEARLRAFLESAEYQNVDTLMKQDVITFRCLGRKVAELTTSLQDRTKRVESAIQRVREWRRGLPAGDATYVMREP